MPGRVNQGHRITSINNATPRTVYPTEGGMSLGMQAGLPGDSLLDPTAGITTFSSLPGNAPWSSAAPVRNVLPTGGQNMQLRNATGSAAGGVGASGGMTVGQAPASGTATGAAPGGFVANPVTWVIVLAVLVTLVIILAHKTGKSEEFANIRGSFFNIFYVTFVAVVGILVLKAIAGRIRIPGLSDAFLAV